LKPSLKRRRKMSRTMMRRAMPLLLALLLITSMALFAPAYADVTDLAAIPDSGDYGDTIVVTGDGITAGKEVRLYWDLVQDWDGEAGLLNTTTAEASGEFEIWFDVPEAVAGTHYVWVEDVEANDFDKVTFTVIPLIDPSATSALAGDRITVEGYGFGGEKDLALLLVKNVGTLQSPVPRTGIPVYSESLDNWDLTDTTYSDTLAHAPVEPDTVVITIGSTVIEDDPDGTLSGSIGGIAVEGTVNYVTGEIELELAQAGYGTVPVSCSYLYYADTTNEIYVFTTAVDTSELGSFTRTIKIPESGMQADDYLLYAFDSVGNEDYVVFTIGAMITLSVDEGPTGTVVEVRGRGFDSTQTVDEGEIKLNGVTCPFADPDLTSVDVEDDGEFRVEVVIPMVSELDEYEISVDVDADGDAEATADFEVTGLPGITLTPEYGKPGDTVTITGENFTQVEDTEVTLTIQGETWSETFELEEDGTFEDTFTLPALSDGDYVFVATDDNGLTDSEEFRIGFMLVLVSPDEAETGELLTLMGRGFSEEGSWNASLEDGTLLGEGTTEEDGDFTATKYLPTVEPGTYDVIFWDIDAEIMLTTTLTVTATTTVTLDPDTAPAGYNVTVTGSGFVHRPGEPIDWVIYNVTATGEVDEDWDLEVWVGADDPTTTIWEPDAVTTDEDGEFEAWFEIPELDPGTYYINATQDEYDIIAQVVLTVIEEELYIEPTKTTFARGDVLSFTFESSFPDEYTLNVYDPEDNLYWFIEITEEDYTKIDTLHAIPSGFWTTYELPSDAPLGTWSWEALDEDDEVVANGTFTVVESALEERFASIDESIESLSEDVSGLQEDISGVKEDISGLKEDVSGVKEDISGLKEDISGVKEDISELAGDVAAAAKAAEEAGKAVSELADVVSEVADTASSAKSAAEEAKAAAEEAKTAASGLTPLIYGAIGVSLIAALAAIVSLIQLSRRIAG